jgi:hypothetical protein
MHQQDHAEERRGIRARFGAKSVRTRSVLAATGVLVVGISATGVAATGSAILEGKRNGTATQETQIISNVGATNAPTGGFSTRQSNLSTTGGGAVYGCRSTTGGTSANPPTNPCIRANNLSSGYAFEFNASAGSSAGVITVGNGGDKVKPFTTNATGVATGLNADQVDGQSADDILKTAATDATTKATAAAATAKERWVLIGSDGKILQQTGGFKTVNCYEANDNCYIDAGSDVTNRAITTEILTANNPDAGTDAQLSGDTSASPCFFDFVNCGPAGTDSGNGGNNGVFVVTPRNSDGTAPAAGDRYAFYAKISAATAAP